MKAIRKIQIVENGHIHLHLPQQFWGQTVEIIVLPAPQQAIHTNIRKPSLRGCLKQYANPDLIAQEQDAWQMAVSEKHECR